MKTPFVIRSLFAVLALFLWAASLADAWGQRSSTTRSSSTRSATGRSTGGGFGGGTRDYLNNTMVGEATISSDPETRRLIVITDEETSQYVSQVVSNLDRAIPQVLIKVVFVEATYREGLDIGIEGSYRRQFTTGTTGVVDQLFGLASQGASPTPPAIGGTGAGLYQILGSDYTVTLRAIAEAGKTEVLSRPSILARNSQQAIITVGQQVPLISNTRFDAVNGQINTVTYQDVGIILRVTPFISANGMVEMIVSPEISELADRSQWVPLTETGQGGALAPTINTRAADTVVVTPHGQTIIIGGLMRNSKAKTVSKIPLLGDIPLLGALFRRTIQSDVKTELLIFLTPYIVAEPTQLAGLTDTERARGLSPSFPEQELNRFLDTLPLRDDSGEKSRK